MKRPILQGPLGVLDWGIGGVGFLQRFTQKHPAASWIYWSDSGFIPYGKTPTQRLRRRLSELLAALHQRGAQLVVVACNAAGTVLPLLRPEDLPPTLHVAGVIPAGIEAALSLNGRRIGVVGGRRTIRSGVYRQALLDAGLAVQQRIAQPLSALIERGDLRSARLHREVERIVAPLANVDALILGCTHYPAIADLFQAQVPRAKLIDPAAATLTALEKVWRFESERGVGPVRTRAFFTTGNAEQTRFAAKAAFGFETGQVKRLALQQRGARSAARR